ncbi:fimbrial protein [Duffyella gerundensis]|uniref:fimbrial protein n=1 Tax=Duffyella TaxID=3026546 RepID=UPI003F6E005E
MKRHLALLLLLLTTALPGAANMLVYPMSLKIDGQEQRGQTINVMSKSDRTQYVRVVIKEVLNPATPQEKEQEIESWQGKGIVISPTRFALAAGATKTVRIIALHKPQRETFYRAYFEPVTAEEQGNPAERQTSAQVSFSLVWGVLIRQLPEKSIIALSRDHALPGITNNGTLRLRLREYSRCPAAHADSRCSWQPLKKSLFPGAALKLSDLAASQALRVRYLDDKDTLQTLRLSER